MSTQKKAAGSGGWFSGALANLESRLDTILADDNEASARQRAAEQQVETIRPLSNSARLGAPTGTPSTSASRDASRTRVSDRLAERLARATAQKTPSRVPTPVNDPHSARTSVDTDRLTDAARSVPDIEIHNLAAEGVPHSHEEPTLNGVDEVRSASDESGSLAASALPINPARVSLESSRASAEYVRDDVSQRPSLDIPNGTLHRPKSASDLQAEVLHMQDEHKKTEAQRQEEMHVYLERIDALQAKLTYLAKETVAAAKEANAAAGASDAEKLVAGKDEKIALLMEEGEKLGKSEMKHMQTIKKLRAKTTEDERAAAELRQKVEQFERSESDLKAKLRRAQVAERQAAEKTKQIVGIEKQVEELRVDRENAAELVRNLTTQLKEAKDEAVRAGKEAASKAAEVDKGKIADLQNELEDAQIEKKLADERAAGEVKKTKEEAQRQVERFAVRELELKNEISGLESRLEAMRSRAEEASSTGGGDGGESSVKLMRQVETLQQQYSLAKGNWETIEGSLNARVAALEKERDDVTRRESELRKKARDVGTRSRRADEELETVSDKMKSVEEELKVQQDLVNALQSKLEQAEITQADAQAELENKQKMWDLELSQRLEEEKTKMRKEVFGSPRPESPAAFGRKGSGTGTDMAQRRQITRLASHEFAERPTSRRSSAMPHSHRAFATSAEPLPALMRRESSLSFEHHNLPPTPSTEIDARISEAGDYEDSSPQRTINDLVSTSTAGPSAGLSVQLVERMSSLVRKLETEKASFKDELHRLSAQRDDARGQVVELMREVEAKRSSESKVALLEKEMATIEGRYDASLEMLGEREEEVEELKSDVTELKRIYRDLVEAKVAGVPS